MSSPSAIDRIGIYYWKCDRAAAFHGTSEPVERDDDAAVQARFHLALQQRFPGVSVALRPGSGQGNHRTFRLTLGTQEAFIRTEDGPEQDCYFEVEGLLAAELDRIGIPSPRVLAWDCSRTAVPFSWQVLDYVPYPDLNQHCKQGALTPVALAAGIGEAIARWQEFRPGGFGPFSASKARASNLLAGLHADYPTYFNLNLQRHLEFLAAHGFLAGTQADAILAAIARHRHLLDLPRGCLVHKDMALWNILGTPDRIVAFIDWDDAISGDPMDDLSLLGCFHDAPVLSRALEGYTRIRPLPPDHLPRFWLHLLRNMLVKAVIRVGAGYFRRDAGFFLIGAGQTGADLEATTRHRIDTALRGLENGCDLSILRST